MASKIGTSQLNKIIAAKKLKPSTVSLLKKHYGDEVGLQTLDRDSDNAGNRSAGATPSRNLLGIDSDLATLTPPMDPYAVKPAPVSPAQAAIDADNKALEDDALAGNIRLPGVNSDSGYNPSNPYAQQNQPGFKEPVAKPIGEAIGDAIVDKVDRAWGGGETRGGEEARTDNKKEGEGSKVINREPVDQDARAEQAQIAANNAAAAAYNKKLEDYKVSTRKLFESNIKAGNEKMQSELDKTGEIAERQSGETAAALLAKGDAMLEHDTKALAEEERKRNLENDALTRRVNEMDRINDELMNAKIDENHWFSSKNLGQQIVMGIAGILQSGAARHNVLQDTMDRDIKIQMENYDRKGKGLAAKNTLYGRMRDLYGDDRDAREKARLATRIAMTNHIDSRLDALAARHAGENGKQNAAIAKSKLAASLGEDTFKLESMLNPPPGQPAIGGALKKEDNEDIHNLGKELVQAKIPDFDSALEAVAKDYAPGGAGHGIGQAGFRLGMATPTTYNKLPGVTPEDAGSMQRWQNMENHFIQAMTGAGMGVEEANRYINMARGDGSLNSRKSGLALLQGKINSVKSGIYAGHKPSSVITYENRNKQIKGALNPSEQVAQIPGLKKN